MKKYISTKQTLKAIEAGARLMLVKIDEQPIPPSSEHYLDAYNKSDKWYWWTKDGKQNLSQCIKLPFNQGDEIYIAEEFKIVSKAEEYNLICYKANITEETILANAKWQPASEMTEQQSRFKFKAGEVSVKRVQDILYSEVHKVLHSDEGFYIYENIEKYFLNWLKNKDIDYEANPWVALVKLKDKECIHCSQ